MGSIIKFIRHNCYLFWESEITRAEGDRFSSVCKNLRSSLVSYSKAINLFSQLMASCLRVVPLAGLMMRPIQLYLLSQRRPKYTDEFAVVGPSSICLPASGSHSKGSPEGHKGEKALHDSHWPNSTWFPFCITQFY